MDGWVKDGRMDEWMDGRTDGCMDAWMDGLRFPPISTPGCDGKVRQGSGPF